MTDAYFYVNIPYHRPATPSFFRLLQRWAGPLLLGTVLATLAWRQDHQPTASTTAQNTVAQTAAQTATQTATQANPAAPSPDAQVATSFGGYTAASPATDDANQAAPATQFTATTQPARAGTHPALVFHNCSVPRMEIKKDRNDMISGVASVSSCDEAKVTLWDTSR